MTELIYALDDSDSTIYILVRDGDIAGAAHWPQPLRAAYPEARFAGTLGGELALSSGEHRFNGIHSALADDLRARVEAAVVQDSES